MNMYYVDNRIHEVVRKEDLDTRFLAPEMYYEYRKGQTDDLITETWSINGGGLIDFTYLIKDKRPSGSDINIERANHFENHRVTVNNLFAYTVPPQWFDEETKDL